MNFDDFSLKVALILQSLIMFIFTIDWIIDFIHRLYIDSRTHTETFFKNNKFVFKSIGNIFSLLDLILFFTSYSTHNIHRFGRFFRPSIFFFLNFK